MSEVKKTLQEAEEELAERILKTILQHRENRANVNAAERIAMIRSHCDSYYAQRNDLRVKWNEESKTAPAAGTAGAGFVTRIYKSGNGTCEITKFPVRKIRYFRKIIRTVRQAVEPLP